MAFKGDLEALILGVLEGESLHGYEISRRIKEISNSVLAIGEGQLYPALHSLEQEGFVSASWIPQVGKPSRKVYTLTEKGIEALAEKRSEWSKFALGVNSILQSKAVNWA